MSAYHQMGNDSVNLVFAKGLEDYRGAILSPVNCDKAATSKVITRMADLTQFEIVFDPQLYFPKSQMGQLPEWDYFPKKLATADLSDFRWWQRLIDEIVTSVSPLKVNAICSPAVVPSSFPNEFYSELVLASDYLTEQLVGTGIESLTTLIVDLGTLAESGRSMEIASIISRAKCNRVYLVFKSDLEPRRELAVPEQLMGAMRLIHALEQAQMRVMVSFCSSDVLLWKHVKATDCATGKFFNLRRFILKRFAEPSSGGGQLPYWFEESLLAFVRQSDLLRIEKRGLLSASSLQNPFREDVFAKIPAEEPWVALSWRQFMWWFADVEKRLSEETASTRQLVETADANWGRLEESPRIFMEERTNDGSWVRQWLRALEELES